MFLFRIRVNGAAQIDTCLFQVNAQITSDVTVTERSLVRTRPTASVPACQYLPVPGSTRSPGCRTPRTPKAELSLEELYRSEDCFSPFAVRAAALRR
ncbi:hypothetical protein RRG08_002750 [Elysia crispata]|uniref:Uncharacterized protein n=1 Tax=Elysia crispata TaxID=231223 RepID=A0AAE1CMC9_9GAST|nr:hypothetical protein RRG08_002750 [Elysia crispata]